MPTLPDNVYRDLINRLGASKTIAKEINEQIGMEEDPVGVIFWWGSNNELLNDERPMDLLFDQSEYEALRRAAAALSESL